MDAEGKDNDVSFVQRKDQEDVSVSNKRKIYNQCVHVLSVFIHEHVHVVLDSGRSNRSHQH